MSQVQFKAKLKRDVFRSETYAVAIFEGKDKGKYIEYKCVGALVPSIKGVTYDITANCSPDIKYSGEKYDVIAAEVSKELDKDEIIEYLSSGMFPGIGRKTAERIYVRFGEKSVETIEEYPEKLNSIKGLNAAKIKKIVEEYKKNTSVAACFRYLGPFGITLKQVNEVKRLAGKEGGSDLVTFVKENPYQLMKIRGITFSVADTVAKDNNVASDDINRVKAAAVQVIKNEMLKGHLACEYDFLATSMTELLKTRAVNGSNIKKFIKNLLYSQDISYKKTRDGDETYLYFYLPYTRRAEEELGNLIAENVGRNVKRIENLESKIKEEELKKNVRLDECQKDAIKTALESGLSIITGGPGTGKTTIINIIADLWEKEIKRNIFLMSPTGKAARRMEDCTKRPAATIHSTLHLGLSDESGERAESFTEDEFIKDSLVIIDESSMIGLFLARDMFKRLKNCQIVLVGDADQLPSVECGRVFADLIESGRIPTEKLLYTHRQSEGSLICDNASRINSGNTKLIAGSEFQIKVFTNNSGYDFDKLTKIEDQMIKAYQESINVYGRENVVLLCPFNKHPAGQLSVNQRIQEIINPSLGRKEFKGKNGNTYRVGDPVMQLINENEISNGEVGCVIAIDKVDNRDVLLVKYDDEIITYDKEDVKNITLAYAMTIHKSQGSEYDVVITCLSDEHTVMLKRNILYTAITRAKKKVCLIGSEEAISSAIQNDTIEERHTLLWHDLKEKIKEKEKPKTIKPEMVQLSIFDEVII